MIKLCAGCGLEREHRTHVRGERNGVRSTCADCQRAYTSRWRREAGWVKAKLANTYKGMLRRCMDPYSERYRNAKTIPVWGDYGRLGIKVCKRWLGPQGYHHFVLDMGPPPTREHSLDRIRCAGNYSPSNTRWSTKDEQDRNRKNTRYVTLKDPKTGETVTDSVSGWSRRVGLLYSTVFKRLARGWEPERALFTKTSLDGAPF